MWHKLALIVCLSLIKSSLFANISIDKKYLLFDKNIQEHKITITNISNKDNWYEVSFVYLKQSKYGTYTKETNPNLMSAEQYFKINNEKFFLQQGANKTIKITTINTQTLNNELNLHLHIKESKEEQISKPSDDSFEIKITPRFAITIPIILRANTMDENAKISNVKFVKDKNNFDNVQLLINLTRTSFASTRLNLIIESDNNTIATINGLNILLSTTQREVLLNLGSIKDHDLKDKLNKPLHITIINANNNIILDTKTITFK